MLKNWNIVPNKLSHLTIRKYLKFDGGAGAYLDLPVLTTTQRDALTASEGMVIFNSTTDQVEEYDGAVWEAVGQVILDTHTADIDAHMADIHQILRTGEYMDNPFATDIVYAAYTILQDTLYAVPFFIVRPLTIDMLVFYCLVLEAAKSARVGIYNDGDNLYPGTLLVDAGTASLASAGNKEVVISGDQALGRGLYWLAFLSDATGDAQTIIRNYGFCPLGRESGATRYKGSMWTVAQAYGVLPNPFTGGGSIGRFDSRALDLVPRLKSLD